MSKYIFDVVVSTLLKIVLPVVKSFLSIINLEEHLNRFNGSKVLAVFDDGGILPTGGVASGRCAPAACAAGLLI